MSTSVISSRQLTKNGLLQIQHDYLDLLIFVILLTLKSMLFNLNIGGLLTLNLFFSSLGFVLLLSGISQLFKPHWRRIFLFVINLLMTFIMLSDLLYYRYYSDVISIPVLLQIGQTDTLEESVLYLFKLSDVLFFGDLILLAAFHFLAKKRIFKLTLNSKRNYKQAICTILLAALLIGSGFGYLRIEMGKGLFASVLDQTFFVNKIGLMNFHLFDTFRFVKDQTSRGKLTAQDKALLEKWLQAKENPAPQGKYFGLAKGKNLIVVQLEAFQNFVLGQTINGQEITPNLNALAKSSLYFPNFYYQTGQGNTSDAEFLTNVSLYPAQEGAAYFRYATNTFFSLPKALKEKDYQTFVFHAFKPSYWNRYAMYQSLGFDKFFSQNDFVQGELVGWGLSDQDFFNQTVNILSTKNKPFYAFLITLSSHYPYNAFEGVNSLDVSPYEDSILGKYLKAVHYTDQAIGKFVEELKEKGLWDNSVVVFYGDHNAFGKAEKELLTGFLKLPQDDLTWLTLQKVPLLIHLPQDKLAGTYANIGGQIDIYPTLANLLGIQAPFSMGKDLLNVAEQFVIFRDGSFLTKEVAYLAEEQKFFDMTTQKLLTENDYIMLAEKYHKELWISDQILQHNLLANPARKLTK